MDETTKFGINLIEKENLLNRWKITDKKLKEIVMCGGPCVVYNEERKRFSASFIRQIQDKFNPIRKDYVPLPPEDREYLKGIFEKIYKDIHFFDLKEILMLDYTYQESETGKDKSKRTSNPIVLQWAKQIMEGVNKGEIPMPTIPEVCRAIIEHLEIHQFKELSYRQISRLINNIGFLKGKPGNKSEKEQSRNQDILDDYLSKYYPI